MPLFPLYLVHILIRWFSVIRNSFLFLFMCVFISVLTHRFLFPEYHYYLVGYIIPIIIWCSIPIIIWCSISPRFGQWERLQVCYYVFFIWPHYSLSISLVSGNTWYFRVLLCHNHLCYNIDPFSQGALEHLGWSLKTQIWAARVLLLPHTFSAKIWDGYIYIL